MTNLGADHIALPIHDVEATLRFYTDVLGLPLVDAHSGDDWGGKPWLMMIFGLGDGRQISLCARRGDRRPLTPKNLDLPHFAFAAPDKRSLKSLERRLTEAKIAFDVEQHAIQRSVYLRDPNGIVIEVTAPPTQSPLRDAPEAHAHVEAWVAKHQNARRARSA